MIGHDPAHIYRAVVIGSGSGGLTVAIGLARLGHDTVLVEGADVGGDCTNTGCIPSKALLHATTTAHPDPLAYARAKRDELAAREDDEMGADERIHLVRGWARLTRRRNPHVVEVCSPDGDLEIRAHHVVVATGSRPTPQPIPGAPDDLLLTNETLFDLAAPPRRLLVIGGGAIGMEMAGAFARLGSAVDVVELQPEVLPEFEPDVGAAVRAGAEDSGVRFHLSTRVHEVRGASTAILYDGSSIEGVDAILLATGREPRIDGLGADAAELETDAAGITVDSWGRTSIPGIWAVGDVTGRTHTTHGAGTTGRRILRAIAWPQLPRWGRSPHVPDAIFTDPPVAAVGCSPAEVAAFPADGRRHHRVDLSTVDRGYTDDLRHGFLAVDAERFTGRLLRAVLVGPGAADLIGMFTMAMDNGIGLRKLYGMVHPYPTYADAIGQIADSFALETVSDLRREIGSWSRARLARRRSPRHDSPGGT